MKEQALVLKLLSPQMHTGSAAVRAGHGAVSPGWERTARRKA